MISPIRVRKATPADKDAVVALVRAINPDDFVQHIFDDVVGSDLYVAELDGRIVACHAEDWVGPDNVFLYAMRVHPDMQGQGVGTVYAGLQVADAAHRGARHLWLASAYANKRAHRTVEKNGFANLGPWFIYEEQAAPEALPAPGRARAGRPGDIPALEAFLERLSGQVLADVVPARGYPYGFSYAGPGDWDLDDLVVVEGPAGLEGVMLLRTCWGEQLYVRRLEGTPEAAADLLAYAARWGREKGLTKWCASLPLRCEPLLAPLGWDPGKCERWYIFHRSVVDAGQ
ncbi:MAG TPA: GNAT family N-acetyltransferase [Symbiobacteriaceae bacterium]|nr:GNAT family N-acetyltransferase [Symbiobacteriaceae bacterium]